MQRWKLTEPDYMCVDDGHAQRVVYVTLAAAGDDDAAPIEWHGDAEMADYMRRWLMDSRGFRGHGMEPITTPADLRCAMRGPLMAKFDPVLVEGE